MSIDKATYQSYSNSGFPLAVLDAMYSVYPNYDYKANETQVKAAWLKNGGSFNANDLSWWVGFIQDTGAENTNNNWYLGSPYVGKQGNKLIAAYKKIGTSSGLSWSSFASVFGLVLSGDINQTSKNKNLLSNDPNVKKEADKLTNQDNGPPVNPVFPGGTSISWQRIAEGLFGGILLVIGLMMFVKQVAGVSVVQVPGKLGKFV